MAQRKRSAGKPGQFKVGTTAYRQYMERKERERKRRDFIGRSRKQRSGSGLAGGLGSPGRRKVKKRGAK
jgi:hypothetical protein